MVNGIVIILIILIVAVLAIIIVTWLISRSSSQPSGSEDIKTQPVVQRFYTSDLKKRSFIVRQNDGRYRVVFQHHSEKVINLRGEIAGWQSQPTQPITDSLASAVVIAQRWIKMQE